MRAEMIQREMHVLECKSVVKVEVFDGLLTAFAKQKKALMIIRGLRAVTDFDYEFQMSWINYNQVSRLFSYP
ncbi:pantetheine-phosphate adenylyltransferase domain protein [Anaplasma phagocytophilum str. NCH-1]|uniref:Pantetheine-phosphate adenylyltransferase domain protein n=1 Tax=Anaplasma phagocytophilum str. NCH-1 TaxID=1359161 RepID=A0A0F3NBA1_ANAPH|nr:pantetheine-phosphate adenylyltransferase domain protein [Anaplasma phagocytophilum str. NCH-1]KJV65320.1 pantetheine-phosphate adenylyltransferase domain protein [Anaplasma phagocytophilum str. NCH-1]